MLDFMQAGGMNMWLMVATAIATAAVASTRKAPLRASWLFGGLVVVLIEGMLGLSTGLVAVSNHFGQFPDKVEALGVGLGELANNGILAVILAVLLGAAALATSPKRGEATA